MRDSLLQAAIEGRLTGSNTENWQFVRVEDIFFVHSSLRIHKENWKNEGIPFLRGRDLVRLAKTGDPKAEIFISPELYERNKAKGGVPQKGDILISAVGTLGKVYVVKGTKLFYYKDAYILCLDNIGKNCSEYIKYVLESPSIQAKIRDGAMATTVQQLTIKKLKSLIVPLPPFDEQHKIVSRLNELLPLCEVLEKMT